MVEDKPDAIEARRVIAVAAIVDDRAHLLLALHAAQLAGDPVGQQTRSIEVRLQAGGGLELARRQRLHKTGNVEMRRHQEGVEGHRQSRRRRGEPAEPPVDVAAMAAQRAMFELQVDDVEPPDRVADFLDVPVCQLANAAMRAAQQVLVEIEHGDVEGIAQLAPQRSGVGGDAAQPAAGRDNREAFLARRRRRELAEALLARRGGGAERSHRHSALHEDAAAGQAAVTPGDRGRTARSDRRCPRPPARSAQWCRANASGGDRAILPAGSGGQN